MVKTILLVFILLFLGSCTNYKKYFTSGKYAGDKLLHKQKIKIEGEGEIKKYQVKERLKQEPVQKLIFGWYMPRLGIYLQAQRDTFGPIYPHNEERIELKKDKVRRKFDKKINERTDTTKLHRRKMAKLQKLDNRKENGNWVMRALGEEPPIYSATEVEQNKELIRNYLRTNGYLNATVTHEVNIKNGYKAQVLYKIKENKPFKIKRIKVTAPKEIKDKVLDKKKDSYLQVGDNFNIDNIDKERNRIFREARDLGYYKFSKQNIYFNIDTTSLRKSVKMEVVVDQAEEPNAFTKYNINNIYFILDADAATKKDTILYRDVSYIYNDNKFSKKLISSKIRIDKGDFYSYQAAEETQRQLGGIDVFKFVNINFQETEGNLLNVFIYASSLKKYQITSEIGVNINVVNYASTEQSERSLQGLPGPFINLSFKNRKVFKGFEIFEASASYAMAGQVSTISNFRSQEFATTASLTMPKILGLNPDWGYLKNQNLSTTISLGYSLVDRVEYNRSLVSTNLTYNFLRRNRTLSISPLELSIINASELDSTFALELQKLDRSIVESFQSSFITSSQVSFTFNNNDPTKNNRSRYLRVLLESGGTLFNFIQTPDQQIGNIPYYTYLKAQIDYRFFIPITKESAFAFRINTGIAKPTGTSESLPYIKYFFIGGLNSNRAWPPRRLGPGTYAQTTTNSDGSVERTYKNEQPGEIVLEGSAEFRGNIIGILDGAIFMDVGNIWWITQTSSTDADAQSKSSEAQFGWNSFYKQIAIGTGVGLRLDFSFLIFRFDIGMKTYDPGALRESERFLPRDNRFAYNLGIGYPF